MHGTQRSTYQGLIPELEELCRLHDLSLEFVGRSESLEDLSDAVLREYELRLHQLSENGLDPEAGAEGVKQTRRLRGMALFITQLNALREKAVVAEESETRASELQRLTAELDRLRGVSEGTAELLETLSVLGHQINNPLTSLLGRAQLLQFKKRDDAELCHAAQVIEESAQRIAGYVGQLSRVVKEARIRMSGDPLVVGRTSSTHCK